MTFVQRILTIAICALGTMLTRFLPFLVFSSDKPTPRYIQYLGKALPAAIFGMLVVYCLRNATPFRGNYALPELFSVALVVGVHLWKRQMLLSVALGTVCYMLLTQMVF